MLREFSIRQGSGGDGKWRGGNGVIREIEFLKVRCLLPQLRNETTSEIAIFFMLNKFLVLSLFSTSQMFCMKDNMSAGILSERRSLAPPGLHGGKCGARGRNELIKSDGRVIFLGGKNVVRVNRGDRYLTSITDDTQKIRISLFYLTEFVL
jgi:5-oxoprolinase (ATP-hydrolysing)